MSHPDDGMGKVPDIICCKNPAQLNTISTACGFDTKMTSHHHNHHPTPPHHFTQELISKEITRQYKLTQSKTNISDYL